MSIHVCKCVHNGKEEYHLRYPGLKEHEAQAIADKINSGILNGGFPKGEICCILGIATSKKSYFTGEPK